MISSEELIKYHVQIVKVKKLLFLRYCLPVTRLRRYTYSNTDDWNDRDDEDEHEQVLSVSLSHTLTLPLSLYISLFVCDSGIIDTGRDPVHWER